MTSNFLTQIKADGPIGYLFIGSISKNILLPLIEADQLYENAAMGNYLPADKKLANIWASATNVSTFFRKDIKFAKEFENDGLKVRFYKSQIKNSSSGDGDMTRHLVMEIVDGKAIYENKYDLESEADKISEHQRINKPICIMKFNNSSSDKIRFFWSDAYAQDGYGYLASGEAKRVVSEIKEDIDKKLGNLNNRELWASVKNYLVDMGAYSLTARGSVYFIPVGNNPAKTRESLKKIMDFINELKNWGDNASCTVWEVQPKTDDYFGSVSEVLSNSLTELSDRIIQFSQDVRANKRKTTLKKEWCEISKHIGLFRNIMGDELGELKNSLKTALQNINNSGIELDTETVKDLVSDDFGENEIEQIQALEFDENENFPQIEVNKFELDIDF